MITEFTCWQCAEKLQNVILPMSRREECQRCSADQHVCKMCKHLNSAMRCQEDRAETVSNLEKANFCDYFAPSGKEFDKPTQRNDESAAAKLAALFGDEVEDAPSAESESSSPTLTPAEIAEQKLRDLLG